MPASGAVLDIGCGPGEITCELARRHPHLSFLGIDHSSKAIQRATRNAASLKLANIQVPGDRRRRSAGGRSLRARADVRRLPSSRTAARVPDVAARAHIARRVDRAGGHVDRPLGAESRRRLAARRSRQHPRSTGGALRRGVRITRRASPRGCGAPPPAQGEGAVERRYALDDFEDFFRGWSLNITGTIAGFDRYPPAAHAESALRPVTGDLAYALVRATEDVLRERDHDGAAKHWVIAATTEDRRAGTAAARPHDRRRADARAAAVTRRECLRRALRAI